MKNTEQTSSNKQLKKWKVLTGVFAGLTAVGIATSITLPLVLNKNTDTPVPTPVPSTHGYDVEGKEYKVSDDGKIAFTITCNEKDNHVLKNIKLLNGETQLGETVTSADMKSGNATVTFTNVTFTDKTNSAKITFNVEGLEGTETISRITINNTSPAPEIIQFDVEGKQYKIENGSVKFTITSTDLTNQHILSNIQLMDGSTTLCSITDAVTMSDGSVEITFNDIDQDVNTSNGVIKFVLDGDEDSPIFIKRINIVSVEKWSGFSLKETTLFDPSGQYSMESNDKINLMSGVEYSFDVTSLGGKEETGLESGGFIMAINDGINSSSTLTSGYYKSLSMTIDDFEGEIRPMEYGPYYVWMQYDPADEDYVLFDFDSIKNKTMHISFTLMADARDVQLDLIYYYS